MRKNIALLVMTLLAAPAAMAFNPQPEPPGFGAIGILNSQSARSNVYFAPPPGGFPSVSCAGVIQLRFYDQGGAVLAQRTSSLAPNAVESLELTPGREGGLSARMAVRADVSWVTVPPGPCRGGSLPGNVEVYSNATGETQFVLPGVAQGIIIVNN